MAAAEHRVVMIGEDGKEYEIALVTNPQTSGQLKPGDATWASALLEEIQKELVTSSSHSQSPTTITNISESTDLVPNDPTVSVEVIESVVETNNTDNEEERVPTFLWTHSAIAALVKTYKDHIPEFKKGLVKKKKMWAKIAKIMELKGYKVNADACDRKWRNLLVTYRMILRRERLNPKKRRSWIYFNDIHEIMASMPNQFPSENIHTHVIHSSSTCRRATGLMSNKLEKTQLKNTDHSSVPNSTVRSSNQNNSSAPHWFLTFAEEERKRHQQQMDILRQIHKDFVCFQREKNSLMRDLNQTLQKMLHS